jgi:putative ABC transport system permease protein
LDLIQVFPIAFRSLAQNKVRSFLTALGVLFGVGAVIAMLSIGEGARREATEQVELLGANTVFVTNTWEAWRDAEGEGLVLRDARALGGLAPITAWTALRRNPNIGVQAEERRIQAEVVSTTVAFKDILNLDLEAGRFMDSDDFRYRRHVCVLGATLKSDLFAFEWAVGRQVKIGDTWFTVIGVAEYEKIGKSQVENLEVPQYNTQVFVPLGLAACFDLDGEQAGRPDYSVDEIVLEVASAGMVVTASELASRVLERLHGQQQDFRLVVPQALLEQSRRTQRTFSIVMGAIAGISLLVGGIGIMNIMLATVLERRHEIGVRRASGATTRAVLAQFLVEAVFLSLVGCAVGILLGVGLSAAVARYAGWRTAVGVPHILIAVGVAGLVGIVSGYYPARKAAGIDPGEALRYE